MKSMMREHIPLTRREREVLVYLVQRYTDPEIAAMLMLSPRTVQSHVANILDKLKVHSRRDVPEVAHRLGLVPFSVSFTVRR